MSPPNASDRVNRTSRWPPEILLAIALSAVVVAIAPLNTDSGWFLLAGRRLLEGARLYTDIIETNPPLIVWLMVPLAAVGSLVAVTDERLIGLSVAAVLVTCSLVALRVLAIEQGASRLHRFALIGAFLVGLTVPGVQQIGQREQLAAILMFPFAMLAAQRAGGATASRPLSIACGAFAGIGIALKPFFLAAWVAVEAVVLLRRRRWSTMIRPETVTIALIQFAYALLLITVARAYLTDVVPMARETYGAYGMERHLIVAQTRFRMLAVLGLTAIVAGWSNKNATFSQVLGSATLGWLVSYVAQGKGWYHHLLPAMAYGASAFAAGVADIAVALRGRRPQAWIGRLSIAIVACGLVFGGIWLAPVGLRFVRGATDVARMPYGAWS